MRMISLTFLPNLLKRILSNTVMITALNLKTFDRKYDISSRNAL